MLANPCMLNWITVEGSIIVSDSDEFLEIANHKGFRTKPLMKLNALPSCSLVFTFSHDAARHTFEIAELTGEKKSVFCALHVFKASLDHGEYTLDKIMMSSFKSALQRQRDVLKLLNSCFLFSVTGGGCQGVVRILEGNVPYALLEEELENGYVHSVAEFFEVHYAHTKPESPCPFNFTGKLSVTGILTVLRKQEFEEREHVKADLERLAKLVAAHQGLLTVANNQVTSFQCNEVEYKSLLCKAAGPRSLELTEFAIGVNGDLKGTIDYGINSQLNEGIEGVHVALGDGSTGFHIDFLCADAQIKPAVTD